MNSLLYYYNNVQKMAAYRQAKRMQRGALTAQGGFYTADPAFRQAPFTIQCVIRPKKVTSNLQVAFNTKGDSSNPRIDLKASGDIVIYGGGSVLYNNPANLDSIYDIVFVATDSQLSLFVDGTLITSVSYTNTISIYNIGFYFVSNRLYFQGDYLLHRHFNYAMSADEVKALENNGDPMGYVVPKLYRQFGPSIEPAADTFEFNEDSPEYYIVINSARYLHDCVYRVDYVVDEWDFQPERYNVVGFNAVGSASIIGGNYLWYSIDQAKIGETQSCLVRMSATDSCGLWIFGGQVTNETTVRHLKVTINSITPVGLLAEYLPQNLMYGRDDKTIATSWLDSAKQLPLSDESMEPLFQSIGGYDMAANGAPEILYYGPKPNSKGVTLSLSPLKAVGVIYTPPISGDMSIQLFAYDDKAISDQTITLMGGVINSTDVEYHIIVYGYEDGYVLSILASGHRLGDVIIGQQGVFSEDIILAVDNSDIRVYANGDFKGNIDTSGYNITLDTIVLTGDAKVTSLLRVFNKALTAEEVATLHNNGNPDAYVLPASMKQGDQRCVLEWLPANIIPDQNNPSTASEWLDTATVLPEDNVQPKITQSVGGYDGMFQGNPTIVY